MAVATKTKPAIGKAVAANSPKTATPDATAIARGKLAAKLATSAERIWRDYADEGSEKVHDRFVASFNKMLANAYPSNPAT